MVPLKSYYKTKRVTMIIIATHVEQVAFTKKKRNLLLQTVYITLTRELCKMENVKISLPMNKGSAQHFPTDM